MLLRHHPSHLTSRMIGALLFVGCAGAPDAPPTAPSADAIPPIGADAPTPAPVASESLPPAPKEREPEAGDLHRQLLALNDPLAGECTQAFDANITLGDALLKAAESSKSRSMSCQPVDDVKECDLSYITFDEVGESAIVFRVRVDRFGAIVPATATCLLAG